MQDVFNEIRQQIHEIRNLVGPFDFKLEALDHQITESRIFFEQKAAMLESKLFSNSFALAENQVKLAELVKDYAHLAERVDRLEKELKITPIFGPTRPLPVHSDKTRLGMSREG